MSKLSRRKLIKQLALGSAGIVLLPACGDVGNSSILPLRKLKLTRRDETMLAALCQAILPVESETPQAWEFVLIMVDDCYAPEKQETYLRGMKLFAEEAAKKGGDFEQLSESVQMELLQYMESLKPEENDLGYFYRTTKKLIIQAYTSSSYYLTQVAEYQLVPGKYQGCVDLKAAS